MKNIFFVFLIALGITFTGFPQTAQKSNLVKENESNIYPIDGTPFLREKDLAVAKYLSEHPNEMSKMKMNKTTAWNFNVGTAHQWYAVNFTNSANYIVSSTCRAIGPHSYIFVEDSLWGSRVNQSAVDAVLNAFESSTPANASKGIYQTDVDTFGDPPDVDNDPRIIILILNIQDGFSGSGGYTAGYFYSLNETNQAESNKAEIYYVDANPTNLNTASGVELAMSTTAHEFQHMINWNYHQTSPPATFINEGLSMVAETICGYPIFNQSLYANETDHYLYDWRTGDYTKVLNDYSRAQRFFQYVHDQFGVGILKNIVLSKLYESLSINDALKKSGYSLLFGDVFLNWEIANIVDNKSVNPAYGYTYPNLTKSAATVYYNPNVNLQNTSVSKLGADYYTFASGSNLKVTFSTSGSNIVVKAIEIGNSGTQVVDVPLNTEFSVPDFGNSISTVHFAVINISEEFNQNYSLVSSGTAKLQTTELKWDETEPTGYYNFSTNDTLAVQFDAYPGGKLDSIRIAMRRPGSIHGGVYEYTGALRPSPLGKMLSTSLKASITTETAVPYPVPYKNWTTVNLSSQNISTDKPFVAAFAVGTDPSAPAIMATDYNSTNAYHSYTYLNNPSSGSPSWYYITSSNTAVAIYLIRAYVTTGLTGVSKEIELTPKDFSLSQNYPNPFNPSTIINFTLPKESNVRIKIFNQLGQVVKELADQNYSAGEHEINFNAGNLSSGVYYYRIDAGNYSSTKKMVLLK